MGTSQSGCCSQYVTINNVKLHYVEEGEGDPILFLHGMPTSSYVWRNIMPGLASLGHCIAPDLIGMGKSDKPDIDYTIHDHIHYIEKLIESLNLKNITLVMHGWGSIIGLDYAMRHEKNCKGLVFYEAYLRPLQHDDISLPYQEQVAIWQEQESSIFDGASFVDKVLNQGMLLPLSDNEMSPYREPFTAGNNNQPLMQYIKEIPTGITSSEVDPIIEKYSNKLTQSSLPKLMLYSVPGFITTIATAMWARDHLPNLEIAEIGEDLHFAQESNPEIMTQTISVWLQAVEQNASS